MLIAFSTIVAACTSGTSSSNRPTKASAQATTTTEFSLQGRKCTKTDPETRNEDKYTLACIGQHGLVSTGADVTGTWVYSTLGTPCDNAQYSVVESTLKLRCDGKHWVLEGSWKLRSNFREGIPCPDEGEFYGKYVCSGSELVKPAVGVGCGHPGVSLGRFTCTNTGTGVVSLQETNPFRYPPEYTGYSEDGETYILAWRYLTAGEFPCESRGRCWGISVITRNGCPLGISATLDLRDLADDHAGIALDFIPGPIEPGATVVLKPATDQIGVFAHVPNLLCR